jgi:hypothetical protein
VLDVIFLIPSAFYERVREVAKIAAGYLRALSVRLDQGWPGLRVGQA